MLFKNVCVLPLYLNTVLMITAWNFCNLIDSVQSCIEIAHSQRKYARYVNKEPYRLLTMLILIYIVNLNGIHRGVIHTKSLFLVQLSEVNIPSSCTIRYVKYPNQYQYRATVLIYIEFNSRNLLTMAYFNLSTAYK